MTKPKIITAFTTLILILTLTTTSASAFFHAEKYPSKTVSHSMATQVFKAQSNAVIECAKGLGFGVGPAKEDSSQARVAVVYSGCESKLAGGAGEKASIKTNGCLFNLHQAKGATEGTVSIECTGTSTILIETNLGCTVKIGKTSNGFLQKLTFTNKSPDIEGKPEISGATDEVNFICNIGGIKANKEGTYTGAGLAEGFESNSPFAKDTITVI